LSVTIEVDAEEMRKSLANDGVEKLAIEIPGAINIADAKCVECGKDAFDDVDAIKLSALLEGAAYVHTLACVALDKGDDIRKMDVPEMIKKMIESFGGDDEEIPKEG